jgi:hypothetical protein
MGGPGTVHGGRPLDGAAKTVCSFHDDVSTLIGWGSATARGSFGVQPLTQFPSDAYSLRAAKGLQPKSVLPACDVTLGEIVGHLVHRLRLQESVSHGVWIRIFGTHGSHRFDRDLWERVMRITNPWLIVILLAASVIGPAIVFYVVMDMATRPNRAILLVLIFMTMPFTVIGSQMAVFYSLQRWLSNYGDFESIIFARGTLSGTVGGRNNLVILASQDRPRSREFRLPKRLPPLSV